MHDSDAFVCTHRASETLLQLISMLLILVINPGNLLVARTSCNTEIPIARLLRFALRRTHAYNSLLNHCARVSIEIFPRRDLSSEVQIFFALTLHSIPKTIRISSLTKTCFSFNLKTETARTRG